MISPGAKIMSFLPLSEFNCQGMQRGQPFDPTPSQGRGFGPRGAGASTGPSKFAFTRRNEGCVNSTMHKVEIKWISGEKKPGLRLGRPLKKRNEEVAASK
jgi:hypothetical protein